MSHQPVEPSGSSSATATPASGAGTPNKLSPQQWRSGIAAWLGWTFDGLDMHIYTLVYTQFVAELLRVQSNDPSVGFHASIIQAGFLLGWAFGGGFFGRIGDRLGRSRALCLTILTYALFTGLSYFAQNWQQLFICRFLSALGIGGEWAIGASLLSETWPKKWRPWMAAVLQTGVNIGVLLAIFSNWVLSDQVAQSPRVLFLVGILPALLVLWIRKSVPETEEWKEARARAGKDVPRIRDLFRGKVARTTWLVISVCAVALSGHWAFLFWHQQQLKSLPEVLAMSVEARNNLGSHAFFLIMVSSIVGNFFAATIARFFGYRKSIALMCLGYFMAMLGCYAVVRPHGQLLYWLALPGFFQGVFALFTMYLPPLFPTLLRTTGAGFCYNIGRVASAIGVVLFGTLTKVGDYRMTLLVAGMLFLPAAIIAWFLPELRDQGDPEKAV